MHCLIGLHVLDGGSYLDLSFGYDVPQGTVHQYAWQALHAIDHSINPFWDNIASPMYATIEQLQAVED
jgi:hypothetical protein